MPVILTVKGPKMISSAPRGVEVPQQPSEGSKDPVMETTHDAYWSKVKHDSAEQMAAMMDCEVPTTLTEVHKLLARAWKCGTYEEGAKMDLLANAWQHACHELREHIYS